MYDLDKDRNRCMVCSKPSPALAAKKPVSIKKNEALYEGWRIVSVSIGKVVSRETASNDPDVVIDLFQLVCGDCWQSYKRDRDRPIYGLMHMVRGGLLDVVGGDDGK